MRGSNIATERVRVLVAGLGLLTGCGSSSSSGPDAATSDAVTLACSGTMQTPGGPDGGGGCWPGPDNVGIPPGTQLSPYTDTCTITTPDTVIDSKVLNCDVIIQGNASGVVIKNSRVNGIVYNDEQGPGAGVRTVTIQDSEINGGQANSGTVWGSYITVIRSKVSGGEHNVHCAGHCTIISSYLHDPYVYDASHNNAFLSNGGNHMEVSGSTLACNVPQNATGGGCSGDLSLFGDFEAIQDVTVTHNLFADNTDLAYCFYGGFDGKPFGPQAKNVIAKDNVFKRGSNSKCGAYGAVTNFNSDAGQVAPGNVWTNNAWDDGTVLDP